MKTTLLILFSSALLVFNANAYTEPYCDNKQVIVHLFEWRWEDIAEECERFLGPAGFCGVQTSPAHENVVITSSNGEYDRPWWERYQPVSYDIISRSGNEDEFADMVLRCRNAGVNIYVDVLANHMAGVDRSGFGTGGTPFDSMGDTRYFPGVPYDETHFTPRELCPSGNGGVDNYADPNNVRNCYLSGLSDLYGELPYVRQKIAGYLNKLIGHGVAGFRFDASKHMWPSDLSAIEAITNNLNTAFGFPENARPFFYHEVIDQDDGAVIVNEYYDLGRVTEFRYCQKIAWGVGDFGQLGGVYDPGWGMADQDHAFIFVDNHDNQRGHGGGGNTLTHITPNDYKLGVAFTLANDYGFTRIMSSYYFYPDTEAGPPHNEDFSTMNVPIDSENQCYGGWVCEHRWEAIYRVVQFRNRVTGTSKDNFDCYGDFCGFSRGSIGYFAMTKGIVTNRVVQTGMPAGSYVDIVNNQPITVNSDGTATINIPNPEVPVLAICEGCTYIDIPVVEVTPSPTIHSTTTTPGPTQNVTTLSPGPTQNVTTLSPGPTQNGTTTPPTSTEPPVFGVNRTVVFIFKPTAEGQDLFIRGGIDHSIKPECVGSADASADPCAIPIITNSLGTTTHYDKYNNWRIDDNYLDWFGAESSQGDHNGTPASGTPLAWTSSDAGNSGYQELNTYGDHYWMIDFDMDCSLTEEGWFDLKGYLTPGGWEGDIDQTAACLGTVGGTAPYSSENHMGKCGCINVFTFGGSDCTIESF